MKWSRLVLALSCAVLLWGGSAGALTLSPNPVAFTNGTDTGTITLVGTATGVPAGGTVLAGAVGVSDITLIFQVTVTGGALESVGIGATGIGGPPFLSSTGAGPIAGPDTDVTTVTGTAGTRIFDFDTDGDLDAGQTSDQFFVSWSTLSDAGDRQINFMINGSVGADFPVSSVVVPEPGFAALLGLGALALLGMRLR
jgi:hypothetical protein